MVTLVAIALGGAVGSVLRYLLAVWVHDRMPGGFPYGTLSVNIIGSFLIGVVFVIIQSRFPGSEIVRASVIVGLLGGFTTFSTFSLETLTLIQTGYWASAVLNIIVSVLSCIICAFLGMEIARMFSAQ